MVKLSPPKLIDMVFTTKVEINEMWFVAKPLEFSGLYKWLYRIRDAYHVLIGKQFAFEYMEDRIERIKKDKI